MGEIANSMINGKACAICSVHLEPGETVYLQSGGKGSKVHMPEDGSEFGVPVICKDCHE